MQFNLYIIVKNPESYRNRELQNFVAYCARHAGDQILALSELPKIDDQIELLDDDVVNISIQCSE